MNKLQRSWLLLRSSLSVIGCNKQLLVMKSILFLLLVSSCAAFAATEEQIQKTFGLDPGGTLVVDVDFGSIDVTTNSTSEVAVDVWRKITRRNKADEEAFLRDNPVKLSQEGTTVTVKSRAAHKLGWLSGWRNRNEAKYTVRVPARFNARLKTSGGGIGVSDLTGEVKADTSGGGLRFARVHGPIDGNTSGGGIRVNDCEGNIRIETSGGGIDVLGGSGSLKGHTSGGAVLVKDFLGPAAVGTSGGGLTLENIKGALSGTTSGGAIKAVLISPVPGAVTLSTSGGGVTLRVPESAAFNLDASTSSGSVSCELPVTVQGKLQRSRLRGVVNGGGEAVTLRSSGGGIHVNKL
ncbi:MAG TPA: DUF4097 family beta strand repeat-containing protein [Verrucomicrobiae bacterium]